jgi:hypothetical protein
VDFDRLSEPLSVWAERKKNFEKGIGRMNSGERGNGRKVKVRIEAGQERQVQKATETGLGGQVHSSPHLVRNFGGRGLINSTNFSHQNVTAELLLHQFDE